MHSTDTMPQASQLADDFKAASTFLSLLERYASGDVPSLLGAEVSDGVAALRRVMVQRGGGGVPPAAVQSDGWREAVTEACVINFVDWDEKDPLGSLQKLIRTEVEMALDPSISKRARALVERGAAGMDLTAGEHEPFRVALCVSSSQRPKQVPFLVTGESAMEGAEKHADFVRWLTPAYPRVATPDQMALNDLVANLDRSRTKYPGLARMFDALQGEVSELRAAYCGDGDRRAEALDVAVCALRIAVDGDSGGNVSLSQQGGFLPVLFKATPASSECPASFDRRRMDTVVAAARVMWPGVESLEQAWNKAAESFNEYQARFAVDNSKP